MDSFGSIGWKVGKDKVFFNRGGAVIFEVPFDVGLKIIGELKRAKDFIAYATEGSTDKFADFEGCEGDKTPSFMVDSSGKIFMDGDHVGWVKKELAGAEHRKFVDFLKCPMQITDEFER